MELMSTDLNKGFTVGMINCFLDAGSMSTGCNIDNFRHLLGKEKLRLTNKLKDIRHKGYYEAHDELVKAELDVPSLLNVAQDHYHTLRDHKRWPATRDLKDSKGINRGYGSVNMTVKGDSTNPTDLPNHVYQLVRAAQNWDKSNDTCNSCGKKGHWSNDCPSRRETGHFPNHTPGKSSYKL